MSFTRMASFDDRDLQVLDADSTVAVGHRCATSLIFPASAMPGAIQQQPIVPD